MSCFTIFARTRLPPTILHFTIGTSFNRFRLVSISIDLRLVRLIVSIIIDRLNEKNSYLFETRLRFQWSSKPNEKTWERNCELNQENDSGKSIDHLSFNIESLLGEGTTEYGLSSKVNGHRQTREHFFRLKSKQPHEKLCKRKKIGNNNFHGQSCRLFEKITCHQ